jgi:uncharacterized cupin superfamily protein
MVSSSSLKDVPVSPTVLPLTKHDSTEIRCCTLHKTLRSSIDVWEYTPGEFEWEVDEDQSTCVICGSAEVDLSDGRILCLEPGQALFLPRGLHGRWIVKETLRTVTVRGC